uniref:Uncharacterized protein n=1 Tax=Magallana gigas TaxID=29159 RepID=A0A8W8P0T0_MAGGI|nr:uncharacterized protein LOC117688429 [Crassostrea gigas]
MNFVQDCLDSFVLGACLHMFGMDSLDGVPVNVEIPHFLHLASIEEQYAWLKELGEQLFKTYIKLNEDSLTNIQMTDQVSEMDDQELLLAEMYDSRINHYSCTCNKTYKTKGHFKRHLEKEHEWDFALNQDTTNSAIHSKVDHVAVWRASFMKLSVLLRDTEDAYHYGDGDRIFRNAKFEMLCADAAHHTKYRLWLWRMQAYKTAILSQRQAVEYKWNCTANTHGGKGKKFRMTIW